MRLLPAVAVALLAAGCVSPSRTDRDYERKAGNTAKAISSSLATVILGADAAERGRAWGSYFSVLIGSAEKDALSVQNTFDSVQPPSATSDRLRDSVDALVSEAVSGISTLRITVRRGQLDELPGIAHDLKPTLDRLTAIADKYQ